MEYITQPLSENERQAKQTLDPLSQYHTSINTDVQEFYNALVLWTCICPTMDKKSMNLSDSDTAKKAINWRAFLNSLCTLSDYDKGGMTVPAIGVRHGTSSMEYWVASNHELSTKKIVKHLEWIMVQLKRFLDDRSIKPEAIEDMILKESIRTSPRKVKFYRQQLLNYVDEALTTMTTHEATHGTPLYSALEQFKELPQEHSVVCGLAYDFCHSQERKILDSSSSSNETLRSVRHYLGRLGSWKRAANTVVSCTHEFKQAVRQAKIVAIPEVLHQPLPIKVLALSDTIHHILPSAALDASSLVAFDRLTCGELRDKFPTRLGEVIDRAREHSEVKVAEYFYSQHFRFLFDYAYIGCSKPSCYMCDKYLQYHPGRFVSRPCHGNVWLKWLIPTSLSADGQGMSSHNREIMIKMTRSIREDIKEQLGSKRERTGKRPDSTTGLTTSTALSVGKL